jgi:hypothetical protein
MAGRKIDSIEKFVAWLNEAIDSALAGPGGMTKEERKKHYPNLPYGEPTDEEKRELQALRERLDTFSQSLRRIVRRLPAEQQPFAENDVIQLMVACFEVGQTTQYGPALSRWAKEGGRKQTAPARAARPKFVEAALKNSTAKRPTLALKNEIDRAREVAGKEPLKKGSLDRMMRRRLRTTEQ